VAKMKHFVVFEMVSWVLIVFLLMVRKRIHKKYNIDSSFNMMSDFVEYTPEKDHSLDFSTNENRSADIE
jgi:hypothetical protein